MYKLFLRIIRGLIRLSPKIAKLFKRNVANPKVVSTLPALRKSQSLAKASTLPSKGRVGSYFSSWRDKAGSLVRSARFKWVVKQIAILGGISAVDSLLEGADELSNDEKESLVAYVKSITPMESTQYQGVYNMTSSVSRLGEGIARYLFGNEDRGLGVTLESMSLIAKSDLLSRLMKLTDLVCKTSAPGAEAALMIQRFRAAASCEDDVCLTDIGLSYAEDVTLPDASERLQQMVAYYKSIISEVHLEIIDDIIKTRTGWFDTIKNSISGQDVPSPDDMHDLALAYLCSDSPIFSARLQEQSSVELTESDLEYAAYCDNMGSVEEINSYRRLLISDDLLGAKVNAYFKQRV